jgi:hypothetical protein
MEDLNQLVVNAGVSTEIYKQMASEWITGDFEDHQEKQEPTMLFRSERTNLKRQILGRKEDKTAEEKQLKKEEKTVVENKLETGTKKKRLGSFLDKYSKRQK